MNIAYITPSLANKAPVCIALNLAKYFSSIGNKVVIFYFDDIVELETKCKTKQIKFNERIDFDAFDIIHSHSMRPDLYVAKNIKYIKKAKTLTTVHCDIKKDLSFSYNKIIAYIFSFLWINSLKKFSTTIQINDCLLDVYASKLKYNKLVYNGVDIKNTHPKEHTPIIQKIKDFHNKRKIVLSSYSVIIKRKGLLQILKLLLQDKNLAYICIGNGNQEEELHNFTKENKIENRVAFFDFIQEPYNIMNYADIFVAPSYSEGFSLALLETGSVGSSVVCSDIPSFNKIFDDTEVTFFELDNIESLHNAVLQAYKNKKQKAKTLQQKITTKFSQNAMFLGYKNVYDNLLQEKTQH